MLIWATVLQWPLLVWLANCFYLIRLQAALPVPIVQGLACVLEVLAGARRLAVQLMVVLIISSFCTCECSFCVRTVRMWTGAARWLPIGPNCPVSSSSYNKV